MEPEPVVDIVSIIKQSAGGCIHFYGEWGMFTIEKIMARFEFVEMAFLTEPRAGVRALTRDSTLPVPIACDPDLVCASRPNGELVESLRSMGRRFNNCRFVVVEHHHEDDLDELSDWLSDNDFHLRQMCGGNGIFVASLFYRPATTGTRS